MWALIAVAGIGINVLLTLRLARKRGVNPWSRLAQLAGYAMAPALLAATALSVALIGNAAVAPDRADLDDALRRRPLDGRHPFRPRAGDARRRVLRGRHRDALLGRAGGPGDGRADVRAWRTSSSESP